jgi:hypothetical protein
MSGNYPHYTEYMLEKYGENILMDLVKESKKICKVTNQELIDMYDAYSKKVDELMGKIRE